MPSPPPAWGAYRPGRRPKGNGRAGGEACPREREAVALEIKGANPALLVREGVALEREGANLAL